MKPSDIPFQTIDWTSIPKSEYKGDTGVSYWQTLQFEGLRIRIVEYSKDFLADHWCEKGHIVHCLEGEFLIELKNGLKYIIKEGMSFVVSDDLSSHRTLSENSARLLIIDGDFLKLKK